MSKDRIDLSQYAERLSERHDDLAREAAAHLNRIAAGRTVGFMSLTLLVDGTTIVHRHGIFHGDAEFLQRLAEALQEVPGSPPFGTSAP